MKRIQIHSNKQTQKYLKSFGKGKWKLRTVVLGDLYRLYEIFIFNGKEVMEIVDYGGRYKEVYKLV